MKYSIGNTANNIAIILYGDIWLVDFSDGSFHKAYKCQIAML